MLGGSEFPNPPNEDRKTASLSILMHVLKKAQTHPAIRTGVEMNLFEKLAKDGGAAKSNDQTATLTSSDVVSLSMLRSID